MKFRETKDLWLKFIFCLIFVQAYENRAHADDIILSPQQSLDLLINTKGKIEINGSEFIQIQDRGNILHLRGKKIGKATIQTRLKTYHVFIVSQKQAFSAKAIKKSIVECEGLNFTIEDLLPTVSGELKSLGCYKNLIALRLSEPWNFRPRMSSEVQLLFKPYLTQQLHSEHLPQGEIILYPYPLIHFMNLKKNQLVATTTWQNLTGIETKNFNHLNERHRTIEVSLYFIEAKKQWLQTLGVSWPPSHSFQMVPQLSATQLQAVLNFTSSEGLANNLASPKLLIKSGEKGEFLSGGEFPIRVSGFQSQALHWKKYGLMFSAKPKIDDSDQIDLELEFELSMIDPARTIDGLPGLISHRMQTQLQIQEGQTIMTTSLLKKEWGRSKTGIPGLREIPLLGKLFESEDFVNNQSELILFIQTKILQRGET